MSYTIDKILEDGCLFVKTQNNVGLIRCSFAPGEFDKLEEFAPELLDQAKEIWTDEIIDKWMKRQEEIDEDLDIEIKPSLSQETAVLYTAVDEIFKLVMDTMEVNAMLMMEVENLKKKG